MYLVLVRNFSIDLYFLRMLFKKILYNSLFISYYKACIMHCYLRFINLPSCEIYLDAHL